VKPLKNILGSHTENLLFYDAHTLICNKSHILKEKKRKDTSE
jgi:hypothetical protein